MPAKKTGLGTTRQTETLGITAYTLHGTVLACAGKEGSIQAAQRGGYWQGIHVIAYQGFQAFRNQKSNDTEMLKITYFQK